MYKYVVHQTLPPLINRYQQSSLLNVEETLLLINRKPIEMQNVLIQFNSIPLLYLVPDWSIKNLLPNHITILTNSFILINASLTPG